MQGTRLRESNSKIVDEIIKNHPEVSKWVAQLISKRTDDPDKIAAFFSDSPDDVTQYDMLNMDKAAEAAVSTLENGRRIFFYGDFDADGMGCSAIAEHAMTQLGFTYGINYKIRLPNRLKENHGLNRNVILEASTFGAERIITMDCGSGNIEEVEFAKKLHMETIVIDHHDVPDPGMDAIMVNPKNPDDTIGDPDFCGAGITYIFMNKIAALLGKKLDNVFLSQIAAISTMADVVPLGKGNIALVRTGINNMRTNPIPFIRGVCHKQKLDHRAITPTDLGWKIAPLMNARGRLDSPDQAYKALLCHKKDARFIAQHMFNTNKKRQDMLNSMMEDKSVDIDFIEDNVALLAKNDWHIGLVGLKAGKDARSLSRVVGCGAMADEGLWKFSFRSHGKGGEIGEVLMAAARANIILGGGGHDGAGGCTVKQENIGALAKFMDVNLGPIDPSVEIDGKVHPRWWTQERILEAERYLHPFGNGNPSIVMTHRGVPDKVTTISGGKHLKMFFGEFEVMSFGNGHLIDNIVAGDHYLPVSFAYTPSLNKWGNKITSQAVTELLIDPGLEINNELEMS